ncbi:Dynein light chain [Meloidogyne graminicola]|uniref:Dynein light chain n=1 Tax=Meloidogyne graminicola TaxID=189291 RepID=A0A8T0A3Z6_9BILA|nr:Dynein light chain [Meloidogyne graminicola]
MEVDLGQICNLACQALRKNRTEWEIAKYLKMKLEEKIPTKWDVIVGKAFGAFITVDARNFLHFRIGRTLFCSSQTLNKDVLTN